LTNTKNGTEMGEEDMDQRTFNACQRGLSRRVVEQKNPTQGGEGTRGRKGKDGGILEENNLLQKMEILPHRTKNIRRGKKFGRN